MEEGSEVARTTGACSSSSLGTVELWPDKRPQKRIAGFPSAEASSRWSGTADNLRKLLHSLKHPSNAQKSRPVARATCLENF
jgi:hypothetical protein